MLGWAEVGRQAFVTSLPQPRMRTPIRFMQTMFVNGPVLAIWIALLLAANMVAPLLFITRPEGQVVLGAAMVGAMIQMAIFARLGSVRLLGIGHIVWVPMLPWLWARLEQGEPATLFGYWLVAVVALDGLSLMVDTADVVRYLRGDRTPHLTVPD